MSIVIELERGSRKAGHVCERSYRNGNGCPLIVRETSEDLLTANVFGILRRIRPELWLRPMLTRAFPKVRDWPDKELPEVKFWQPVSPPSDRVATEGNTEVDVHVRWGKVCLYIEAKYRAELSPGTVADSSRDQLIRLLDVVYEEEISTALFRREALVLVVGMSAEEPELVTRYRSPSEIRKALRVKHDRPLFEKADYLSKHVGYVSWTELSRILAERPKASDLEGALLADVSDYIRHKRTLMPVVHSAARACA
jgi:hypothetical protein